jgi:hypothetical protein
MAAAAVMTTTATTLPSSRVFTTTLMTRIAYVALSIPCFVCVEVVERLLSARWCWSSVTVPRIIAVVYVSVKAMRAVKPGASPDEKAAAEPIRAIVAVGRASIGRIVIIAIGASGFLSYVDTDLSRCSWAANQKQSNSKRE